MRATVMYGAHDVRVETVPDARIVEPTDAAIARSPPVGVPGQVRGRRVKQRIGQAAYPDSFTLIDLRPIRPLVFGARHKALDADLVRVIPSQNL